MSAVENSNRVAGRHERHRTLSGETRLRLLDALRRAGRPARVRQLAEELGLHENTVREQLDRLVSAGLVGRADISPAGRGRPAREYEATAQAADAHEQGSFRELALVLTDQIARGPNADQVAIEVGVRWGRAVARKLAPVADGPAAISRVVSLLDGAGFEPEEPDAPGKPLVLHRCPFGALAVESGGVVCQLHLGMLRGVLEQIRAPLVATHVEPFAAPGICFAYVETAGQVAHG
jgi:predicted ArsR family transcriptional regulator